MAGKSSMAQRLAVVPRLLTVVVVLALLAGAVIAFKPDGGRRYLTVDFPQAISLYEGSDVRILGVPVGKVETVSPKGDVVEVSMWYSDEFQVPADAKAVIVSPAIVGDRFVQLTPAYTGGAVMPDGEQLDMADSAVPLELDEIYQAIDDLSVALGPEGANKNGALSRLVNASAANLDGTGATFRQTLYDLSLLTTTLSNNKDELFSSVAQVQRFVQALATNDAAVRRFNQSLASVAGVLEGERDDLAATLRSLGIALGDVRGFVQDNQALLSRNVKGLVDVTKVLVDQRAALKASLEVAPLALTNLTAAYDPRTGTLSQRSNLDVNLETVISDPSIVLCSILDEDGGQGDLCTILGGVIGQLPAPGGGGPGLPLLQRVTPFGSGAAGKAQRVVVEPVDTSLAALLEVSR
jgi:phospholipid/cholesterol/gamma-HCH transport system substrate-binding protein